MAHLKKRNGHLSRVGPAGSGHLVRACVPPGLPCSYCGPTGPITGGVISFSGIPTTFSYSYTSGATSWSYVWNVDLNHSRVIDLIQVGIRCCWYAPAASIANVDFTYTRTGPSPATCNRLYDIRTAARELDLFAHPDPCDNPSGLNNGSYSIQPGSSFITQTGSCGDLGGTIDYGSACGIESQLEAIFFQSLNLPPRIKRQVLAETASGGSPTDYTGKHLLSVCPWTKTLNCGLGNVTWTPF